MAPPLPLNFNQFRFTFAHASYMGFIPRIALPSTIDPCLELCTSYSANRLGDGFDLCDDPRQSTCDLNTQICGSIFWSTDVQGQSGLVYELDEEENRDLPPVTCREALELVQEPGRWLRRNHVEESIIHSALIVFTHLFPHTPQPVYDGPLVAQSRLDVPPLGPLIEGYRENLNFYELRSALTVARYPRFALPSIGAIEESIPRIQDSNVLSIIRTFPHPSDTEPFLVCDIASIPGIILSQQNLVDDINNHYLDSDSRSVLVLNFASDTQISLLTNDLRFGSSSYGLVAIVQRTEDRKITTVFLRNSSWHRLVGNAVARAEPPYNRVLSNVISLFYSPII